MGLFTDLVALKRRAGQAAYLMVLIGGLFWFARLWRRDALEFRAAWSGLLLGLGGFQLFDGVIDHKVLRVHQIRYGVDDLFVYDLVWNAVGLLLIGAGAALTWRRGARPARARSASRRRPA